MGRQVVLTGVGTDRVGIVADLTQTLFELGCNLLDSSMTLLRGDFAIIVMVELPDSMAVETLEKNLALTEAKLGMKIHIRLITEDDQKAEAKANDEQREHQAFIVSVYGADKPGIVAKVTRELAAQKTNITDVQTKRTGGNNKIFVMLLEVTAPPCLSPEELRKRLENVSCELGIDISVQSLDVVEL